VGAEELREFVSSLDIGPEAKARLLALTPAGYVGLAAELVGLLPD
jgi:adenylosuccinate lyase